MSDPVDHAARSSAAITVGSWLLHPAANAIERDGQSVRIEPKAMAVLTLLAQRAGETVSRQQLLEQAWPGLVVSDDALTQVIIKLRKALGDSPRNPEYIRTIPKRGYLLVAKVATASTSVPVEPHNKIRRPFLLAVVGMLAALGLAVWFGTGHDEVAPPAATAGPSAESLSIAVLAFDNLDPVLERHDFARAITSDLTTDLSKLSGLWVVSASIIDDAPLPARYLVTGSVQHSADRLNVTVRLHETKSQHQIWSERYDRPLIDLFDVQQAISQEIVKQLEIEVSAAEKQRLARRHTQDLAAYEDFLRGQQFLLLRQQQANQSARDWYRQAVEKDPGFARAYAGLALSHAADYRNQWVEDGQMALHDAARMAQTALQIDPDIAEVHWVLGYVDTQERRLKDALRRLERAIELDHSFADAYALMGGIHTYRGRPEETLPLVRQAMRLKPDAGYLYYLLLGRAYFYLGDYEQSIINLSETLSRNPDTLEARIYLTAAFGANLDREEASWQRQELTALKPDFELTEWLATYPMVDEPQRRRLVDALMPLGL